MSEEPSKKGIMLSYANNLKFADLENNDSIKKFLDGLGSRDTDADSPGYKVVDFGAQDHLEDGQIQVIGGEDVKEEMGKVTTFVADGPAARYIFKL